MKHFCANCLKQKSNIFWGLLFKIFTILHRNEPLKSFISEALSPQKCFYFPWKFVLISYSKNLDLKKGAHCLHTLFKGLPIGSRHTLTIIKECKSDTLHSKECKSDRHNLKSARRVEIEEWHSSTFESDKRVQEWRVGMEIVQNQSPLPLFCPFQSRIAHLC
mgnify:CR=1 FL=1